MSDSHPFVDDESALIVLGGLNAKVEDRAISRGDVLAAQAFVNGRAHAIEPLATMGELGVSSLAVDPHDPDRWFVSTGDDLLRFDLADGDVQPIDIEHLRDVHEMTVVDQQLWLANTGYDEAVQVDPRTHAVQRRCALAPFAVHDVPTNELGERDEVRDRFHCNQVFAGLDDRLYALVHHVTGKQILKRVAEKLIKQHGSGGVIDLDTGRAIDLGLTGPHSVRVVCDQYWICDSGRSTIEVFSRDWRHVQSMTTRGWGRGAALSADRRRLYVGISATRKRYLKVFAGRQISANAVEAFDVAERRSIGAIDVPAVEQVNNVYVVPRTDMLMSRLRPM